MKLDISLVPYGALTHTVKDLEPYLQKAAALTSGRSVVDDIVRMFYTGQYSLWSVFDVETNKPHGFFATEIKMYAQRRMLCVQHCVIEPQHLAELESRIEDLGVRFAKDCNCSGIEFSGRPGWRKYSKANGYWSHSVQYQRFFDVAQ